MPLVHEARRFGNGPRRLHYGARRERTSQKEAVMRVVVISTPIFRLGPMGLQGYGGLEQIAWECAKGLAKLGHQVALIAPDGSECPFR